VFNVNMIDETDLRKWVRFILSCSLTAFVSFWGTYAGTGWEMLREGFTPELAKAWAIFSGAGAMAAATLATARANELWKELTVILSKPPADPASLPPATPPHGATDTQAARPPYLTG